MTEPTSPNPPRLKDLANLPGLLTLARLPLAGVFALVAPDPRAMLAAYGLGVATDLVDGVIARRSGLVSQAGAYADGFADKVFHLAVAATLFAAGLVPGSWIAAWFAREIVQVVLAPWLGLRLWREPGRARHANRLGKATTLVIGCAVFLVLLDLPGGALVFTVLAGALGTAAAVSYALREVRDPQRWML